jgi:hypothetical protein
MAHWLLTCHPGPAVRERGVEPGPIEQAVQWVPDWRGRAIRDDKGENVTV